VAYCPPTDIPSAPNRSWPSTRAVTTAPSAIEPGVKGSGATVP
jgi:hypothetical protein